MNYSLSLSPLKIGRIEIKNRYAVGPMGGRNVLFGPKGEYSVNGIDAIVEKAKGGFGLITLGAAMVDTPDAIDGAISPNYAPGTFRQNAIKMVERVHAYGSKIFMQVSMGHGRMRLNEKAPSVLPCWKDPNVKTSEMTREDIEAKIDGMVKLAKLAKSCGFDGVEVHGMHWGYVLDQFAMEFTNKRTDEFGGSLENRLRCARMIVERIKEACGADYPVSIRFCMKTYMKGFNKASLFGEDEVGRTIEEAVEIARLFEQYGYDMLNCNSGTYDSFYYCVAPYYMSEGYNIALAEKIKAAVKIPVFVAGNMDDPDMCEKALEDGKIDGITLARASLADPHYVKKLEMGQADRIRPCIKCTNCIFTNLDMGTPLCSVNPCTMQEHNYGLSKTITPKKVIVVGGGVTGMEAARTAKLAGHDVELYERENTLGGHLIEAGSHPFKAGIKALCQWYEREMAALDIPVHLGHAVTADELIALAPDTVIVSAGSEHFVPPIPGHDHAKSVVCKDVLTGKVKTGQNVVIVGGGLTGAELAYDLAALEGKNVTLVEALDNILSAGAAVPTAVKMMLTDLLDHYNVNIMTGHRIASVADDGAHVTDKAGCESVIPADNVVFAIGLKPNKSKFPELYGHGIEVYSVGDCSGIGNIRTAVASAYEIARSL